MPLDEFNPPPSSTSGLDVVLSKVKALQAAEIATPGFDPKLQTICLTHGKRTQRVVLWFHGYTSAPLQFKDLGELCFGRGYNVLIPCIPHHGLKDRMSPEVSRLKHDELIQFTNRMVDLASGLGEEVIVGGLSLGGTLAGWVAQEKPVSMAIVIAPFLGARIIPDRLIRLVALGARILPDKKLWGDGDNKEHVEGPSYGYYQYSTHSLVQILKVAFDIFEHASKTSSSCSKIYMLLNDHDNSVSNTYASQLVRLWKHWPDKEIIEYHVPDELGIPHNCIDREMRGSNTDFVYGKIMEMIG